MHNNQLRADIVLPVYNEEECLEKNVSLLLEYLRSTADFGWNIIIADNASTDKTAQVAQALVSDQAKIKYMYFPVKGRGGALKKAFLESSADVVAYMDIDLSTNLRYLKLLIEGISCGFDIAVGSRLMQGSRVKRRWNREIISRVYNLIIKLLFYNRFSDAQCGFKAMRADVAKLLLPQAENNSWFFDTELLLLAEHYGYKIFEVPVEWTEDIKTKVRIVRTVLDDLRGLLRMRLSLHKKRLKD